ncbi:MAG: hypothetical protein AAF067_11630 [Pseudomonadota bacterium]
MALFAIIKQPGALDNRLSTAIRTNYEDNHFALGDGVWLVSDSITARDIAEKLHVTAGDGAGASGSAIVLEVASYFGRANPDIWSWMKNKWERPPSG